MKPSNPFGSRLVFLAAVLCLTAFICGGDEGNRLVTIKAAADGTGSGWITVWVPGNQPGATPHGCFLEPGKECVHRLDPEKPFEIVALADNFSTFRGWGQACTGTDPSCAVAAGEDEVTAEAGFSGEFLAVEFRGAIPQEGTWPGELVTDHGHSTVVPWWTDADPGRNLMWEVMVPAGGETTIRFTGLPAEGGLVSRLEITPDELFNDCGPYVVSCEVTLDWDQLTSTVYEERYGVLIQFEEIPPVVDDDEQDEGGGGIQEESVTAFRSDWVLSVTPEPAGDGLCSEPMYEEEITIVVFQIADVSLALMLNVDGATAPYQGTYDEPTGSLVVGGSKSDRGGTTVARFELNYDGEAGTLNGEEFWGWTGSGGTCPDGHSEVTGLPAG